jgi:DNA-binding NarL/FixJ family response regulator
MNRPTADDDDARVAEAVQMGVRGWVAKQSAIESLLTAVQGAAREANLPAVLRTRVLVSLSERGNTSTPEADAIAVLSARELEVLRCLIEGLSRNEIGALLYITPNTVRTHIQNIFCKLNVHSAVTAVAFARRAGVVGLRKSPVNPANDVHRSAQERGSLLRSA